MSLFKNILKGKETELESLQTSHESLQNDFNALQATLATAQEELSALQSERETLFTENQELKLQLSQTENTLSEVSNQVVDIDEASNIKAASLLSSLGHEPLEITEDVPQKSLTESLRSLKGYDLVKFVEENKKQLFPKN